MSDNDMKCCVSEKEQTADLFQHIVDYCLTNDILTAMGGEDGDNTWCILTNGKAYVLEGMDMSDALLVYYDVIDNLATAHAMMEECVLYKTRLEVGCKE